MAESKLKTQALQDLVTSAFGGVLSAAENTIQKAFDKLDDHGHSGLFVPVANANDIFRCNATVGSQWTGKISGAPVGAVVTYTHTSGNKESMIPAATTQLGKQRLYNITRGNYALISTSNGSTTITLTANAPANWANLDVITTCSQTTPTYPWVDIEITAGEMFNRPGGMVVLQTENTSTTTTCVFWLRPFSAVVSDSLIFNISNNVQIVSSYLAPIVLANNAFSVYWGSGGSPIQLVIIRQQGYFT